MNFKFKISNFKFFLVALLGVAMMACTPEENQTEFYLQDLQGEWVEDGTTHHIRFTTEQADESNYFWGCEWGVDDVEESDLVYHGNGWFKYNLNEKLLLEINKMDYGWADIPKRYILTILTEKKMVYHERDDYSKQKYRFTKQ